MKKLTTKEFIDRAKKIHGNVYEYRNTIYQGSRHPVNITCPIHGDFLQTPDIHLSGAGCAVCGNKKRIEQRTYTTETFLQKAKLIHGSTYNYSNVKYVNSKTHVKIICKEHGEFLQKPNCHLSGQGCPTCANINTGKLKTIPAEKFIDQSNLRHNNFYDYSCIEYKNSFTKVNIKCPLHGNFKQRPYEHLNGHGCLKCSIENSKASIVDFKEKAKNIYGEQFNYDNSCFIRERTGIKVLINCPIHGDFSIWKSSFLKGQGCKQCSETHPGFSKTSWVKFCKDKGVDYPTCYIIRLFNEQESFIKIGITTDLRHRLNHIPYNYESIYLIVDTPEKVFEAEKRLHKLYKSYKYIPQNSFNGQQECFSMTCFS